ncbi:MAG TPA: hypothetical protein VN873_07650 [Candidatus Angelobacter sp.]|nr:hypothetical protein [Candidatus Angelobacter sp.]
MFSLVETHPQLEIQESEYQRLLGYPKNHPLEGRARELADEAQAWYSQNGRPWISARELQSIELKIRTTSIGGTEFSSKKLRDILFEARAHSALLVAISAGKECEEHARELWNEGKPDEYFFLETYGSAVVEELITFASSRICAWADENKMAALPHFSPGYSGWDFAEQVPLWNLFRKNFDGNFPGELDVLESGMLRPKKSLLAVIGLTHDLEKANQFRKLIPCETCSLPNCRYRRAPHKRSRPQMESVSRK